MYIKEKEWRRHIRNVFSDAAQENNNPDIYLTHLEICERVYKKLNKHHPEEFKMDTKERLELGIKTIRTPVSKMCSRISEDDKNVLHAPYIIKEDAHGYRLNSTYYKRVLLKDDFKNNIIFLDDKLFMASNTVVVMHICRYTVAFAETLFRHYINDDSKIYNMISHEDRLYVFLNGSKEERTATRRTLLRIIKSSYKYQQENDIQAPQSYAEALKRIRSL